MERNSNLFLLALNEVYQSHYVPNDEFRFLSPNIGFVRSFQGIINLIHSIFKVGQPYRLTEGRIVYLSSGKCRLRVNLKEIELQQGELIVASPGTVFEFIEFSSDFDLSMLAFSNDLIDGWFKEELIQKYLQGRLFINVTLTEGFHKRIEKIFDLIWDIVHDENFSKDEIRCIVFILFHQVNNLYKKEHSNKAHKGNRQEEIFNSFLSLINTHAIQERNLTFYANKLYITPRYLSTLIKQESGRTVMDWINDAAIQEIKLQLRHSDKLIYQISDDMNFPNSSFFTKYFRRLTGMTPKEYREMILQPA